MIEVKRVQSATDRVAAFARAASSAARRRVCGRALSMPILGKNGVTVPRRATATRMGHAQASRLTRDRAS